MGTLGKGLMQYVAPVLAPLGYRYDAALRDGSRRYGFRKDLGEGIQAIIWFQQSQYASKGVAEFTIELERQRTRPADPPRKPSEDFEGYRRERLSGLLWAFYGLRRYPQSDHWWLATGPEEMAAAFADALSMLQEYGIPWLEDPHPRSPVWLPITEEQYAKWRAAVARLVAPALTGRGYVRVPCVIPNDEERDICFERQLVPGVKVMVALALLNRPSSPLLRTQARLQRTKQRPAFDEQGPTAYQEFGESLDMLTWRRAGVRPEIERKFLWEYETREQLEVQLRDVAAKLVQLALPLMEDPASTFTS